MKKLIVPILTTVLASSSTTFACDGSVRCVMRQTPRQVAEMLPGFLANHAGLLIGMALFAVFIGISLSRRTTQPVKKD